MLQPCFITGWMFCVAPPQVSGRGCQTNACRTTRRLSRLRRRVVCRYLFGSSYITEAGRYQQIITLGQLHTLCQFCRINHDQVPNKTYLLLHSNTYSLQRQTFFKEINKNNTRHSTKIKIRHCKTSHELLRL